MHNDLFRKDTLHLPGRYRIDGYILFVLLIPHESNHYIMHVVVPFLKDSDVYALTKTTNNTMQ